MQALLKSNSVFLSLSVPEKCGILGSMFRVVVPDAPGTAGLPA